MKRLAVLTMLALTVVLAGCTTTKYREAADKQTYGIIQAKSPAVPNMDPDFTIEELKEDVLAELPQAPAEDREFLGAAAAIEEDAFVISLEQALALAVNHNRNYQNQKESVFLQALALTLERRRFDPIFSGRLSGDITGDTVDVLVPSPYLGAGNVIRDIGELTGTAGDLLEQYARVVDSAVTATGLDRPTVDIVDRRAASGVTRFGVEKLLRGGGLIAVQFTSNFFRFITGDPQVATSSALVASFSQPLWRGAGRAVVEENLTQAERDVLYSLRSFTHFRKEFAVDIAASYYDVLQARDAAYNNWRGYQSFLRALERGRAVAAEGRMGMEELGRLEQAALSGESDWVNAVSTYGTVLDRFKIQLGLPTDAPVILEPRELAELEVEHPEIDAEDAVTVALTARLDLYNQRDSVDDAARRVVVAANSLRPDVNLLTTLRVDSKPERDAFDTLDFRRAEWSAGLDVGLPLERRAERNRYRAALITEARSHRELELAEDNVSLQVRDAWRRLDQAKRNYEISLLEVELSERRVEEQELRMELGLVTAINLVDAQNALIRAQNRLTAALVNHTITRLSFWRDMGILYIKKDGQWEPLEQETMPAVRLDTVVPRASTEADLAIDAVPAAAPEPSSRQQPRLRRNRRAS
jgi:outer membrane protein TolC